MNILDIVIAMNLVLLIFLLVALVLSLLQRLILVNPFIDFLDEELEERQERHIKGWRELHAGFDRLATESRKNRLASEYAYTRTKLLQIKDSDLEATISYPLAVITGTSVPITELFGIHDNKVASTLLLMYPSIDAIINTSENILAETIGADIGLVGRIKENIMRRINAPEPVNTTEGMIARDRTSAKKQKDRRKRRWFWQRSDNDAL